MKTLNEIKELPNLMIQHIAVDGGLGVLFKAGKSFATVVWSNGGGWEHVSISPFKRSYTPTWDEMCKLKEMPAESIYGIQLKQKRNFGTL